MEFCEEHICMELRRLEASRRLAQAAVDASSNRKSRRRVGADGTVEPTDEEKELAALDWRIADERRRLESVGAEMRERRMKEAEAAATFKSVEAFLQRRRAMAEFPSELFAYFCSAETRWRFCAAALRDARVTRPDRAVIVAWMLVVTNMNAMDYPPELGRVVADDPTCLDVLFPALWARVAYYRARRPGFQVVKLTAGDKADARWYWSGRQVWSERLHLTADEDGALDRICEKKQSGRGADGKPVDVSNEVVAFVDAMKRAGRRPSQTLLLGLFDSLSYWDVVAYLYEHDHVCWTAWPVEEALMLHCADGDVHHSCEFVELVNRLRPGIVGRVRDPFGCNLLWLTLYKGLATYGRDHGHWASASLEKLLIDCGCDPHETNALGVSWADVARAQYACGISRRNRELDLWADALYDEFKKPYAGMGWLAEILGVDWHEPDESKDGR